MRPFTKTAATLVRPHPFSTLCTTPLGKMTLCVSSKQQLSTITVTALGSQSYNVQHKLF